MDSFCCLTLSQLDWVCDIHMTDGLGLSFI